MEQAAAKNNPELKSALASLDESNADVQAAWGALLPNVGLNVTYGIDANQFAVNGPLTPDGLRARNLGYSASVTVNLPVWDWLASEHKVKQSEIRRDATQVALTAQRQLIAQLEEVYSEAQSGKRSTGVTRPERDDRSRKPATDQTCATRAARPRCWKWWMRRTPMSAPRMLAKTAVCATKRRRARAGRRLPERNE